MLLPILGFMLLGPFGEVAVDSRSLLVRVEEFSKGISNRGFDVSTCVMLLGVVAFLVLTSCGLLLVVISAVASLGTDEFKNNEFSRFKAPG